MTNDGELINEMTHPSIKVPKIYIVNINGKLSPEEGEKMYNGFEIETELVLHCVNNKMRLVSIPCDYANRPEGSVAKLNTFRDGWKIIKLILKTKRIK